MILNKKFGITITGDINKEIHFRDRNNYEFLAYLDACNYNLDIKQNIKDIKNIKTIDNLINFLETNCGYKTLIMKNGPNYSDNNSPILQFGNDKQLYFIQIFY